MHILTAEFIRSCHSAEQIPAGSVPEFAFVGRSNVGKSSLINALLRRKSLAKVSRTPGKTRAINLFSVSTDDPLMSRFLLVDLPGYGYANVSKDERARWAPLIERYLTDRSELRAVVLLVESRVLGDRDRETLDWLTAIGRRPLLVATKVDKVKAGERVVTMRRLRAHFDLAEREPLIVCSSTTGEGRDQLWTALKQSTRT